MATRQDVFEKVINNYKFIPLLIKLKESLNAFMSLERPKWVEARATIKNLLSSESELRDNETLRSKAFVKQREAKMHLPAEIGMLQIISRLLFI